MHEPAPGQRLDEMVSILYERKNAIVSVLHSSSSSSRVKEKVPIMPPLGSFMIKLTGCPAGNKLSAVTESNLHSVPLDVFQHSSVLADNEMISIPASTIALKQLMIAKA